MKYKSKKSQFNHEPHFYASMDEKSQRFYNEACSRMTREHHTVSQAPAGDVGGGGLTMRIAFADTLYIVDHDDIWDEKAKVVCRKYSTMVECIGCD